jgi:hypothetical protein
MSTRINVNIGDGGLLDRNAQQQAAARQANQQRASADKAAAEGQRQLQAVRISQGRDPLTGERLPSAGSSSRIQRIDQKPAASRAITDEGFITYFKTNPSQFLPPAVPVLPRYLVPQAFYFGKKISPLGSSYIELASPVANVDPVFTYTQPDFIHGSAITEFRAVPVGDSVSFSSVGAARMEIDSIKAQSATSPSYTIDVDFRFRVLPSFPPVSDRVVVSGSGVFIEIERLLGTEFNSYSLSVLNATPVNIPLSESYYLSNIRGRWVRLSVTINSASRQVKTYINGQELVEARTTLSSNFPASFESPVYTTSIRQFLNAPGAVEPQGLFALFRISPKLLYTGNHLVRRIHP